MSYATHKKAVRDRFRYAEEKHYTAWYRWFMFFRRMNWKLMCLLLVGRPAWVKVQIDRNTGERRIISMGIIKKDDILRMTATVKPSNTTEV